MTDASNRPVQEILLTIERAGTARARHVRSVTVTAPSALFGERLRARIGRNLRRRGLEDVRVFVVVEEGNPRIVALEFAPRTTPEAGAKSKTPVG